MAKQPLRKNASECLLLRHVWVTTFRFYVSTTSINIESLAPPSDHFSATFGLKSLSIVQGTNYYSDLFSRSASRRLQNFKFLPFATDRGSLFKQRV